MDNCVLSNQQRLIISNYQGEKNVIQIGFTTRQFGDCRIENNEHDLKINQLMKIFQADECVRMVPSHKPKIMLSLILEGDEIKTADCDGIIHFKPKQPEFVSLIHCGWRTIAEGIIEKAVKNILRWCPVSSRDIKAIIYGGICPLCYEVDSDVIEKFQKHSDCFRAGAKPGKYHLSLAKIINQKLLRKGLCRENIRIINICSHYHNFRHINSSYRYVWNDDPLLFSHRRGEPERNLVLAKLKNDNTLIAGTTGNCPYVILYNV
jgi:hypothetical protein